MTRVRFPGFGAAAALLLAIAGFLVSPAGATQITYSSYTVTNDVNVHITCSNVTIPGCVSGYYGSGQINLYNGNNLVAQTWCVDVTHDLLSSGIFTVTLAQNNGGISNIRDDGGSGTGHFLSWTTVGELGALMRYGAQNIGSPDVSSAVQLAMWNLEYGANITTLSDSGTVQTLAASLLTSALSGALGYDWNVAWLHYCADGRCNQAQLELLPVPEPPGLAIFGAAMLALTGCWLLRRQTSSPM